MHSMTVDCVPSRAISSLYGLEFIIGFSCFSCPRPRTVPDGVVARVFPGESGLTLSVSVCMCL